jgi:hypothetical protein
MQWQSSYRYERVWCNCGMIINTGKPRRFGENFSQLPVRPPQKKSFYVQHITQTQFCVLCVTSLNFIQIRKKFVSQFFLNLSFFTIFYGQKRSHFSCKDNTPKESNIANKSVVLKQ